MPESAAPAPLAPAPLDPASMATTAAVTTPTTEPLRSVHTTTFPELLKQLGISIAVTTYQAGKLLLLREDSGKLNTHFRGFIRPMGLAVTHGRIAVGTASEVWDFHNVPAVATQLEPNGKHDACYLPRSAHFTGDILVHEMAWGGHDLWIVNTRFSCLCMLDAIHSFVPRWRPPFISAFAAEDRCHLNGLAMIEGKPAFVTALGVTDSARGWRENKRNGGVLMSVPSGEVIADGLSMPHSPRWHGGHLWLLESGTGTLGTVDQQTGRYQPMVELPGFTRGLDFCGRFAFVGLSQVRETAIFSDLPITERPERNCGVWVVDVVEGKVVAFVHFEDAMQEIFAVQVLPGQRFPDLINDDVKTIADSFVLPDDAIQ